MPAFSTGGCRASSPVVGPFIFGSMTGDDGPKLVLEGPKGDWSIEAGGVDVRGMDRPFEEAARRVNEAAVFDILGTQIHLGFSRGEIADQWGVSVQTLSRQINKIKASPGPS